MKLAGLCAALLVLGTASVNEAIECREPQPRVGYWELGVDKKECVALVKELCDGMRSHTTRVWRRGKNVREDCETSQSIGRLTAIATFLGANNGYEGHAAIFDSCASDGIWVFDQWNATNGYLDRRKIPYMHDQPHRKAGNFYVIEL